MWRNLFLRKIVLFSGLIYFITAASNTSVTSSLAPAILFELLALNGDIPTAVKPKYRSPVALVSSPDGSKIYICEQTAKCIAVFDIATGLVTGRMLLPNEVTGCAVSPDGTTLASGGVDSRINLWNLKVKQPALVATLRGHTSGILRAVFSPDGNTLATASKDGTVRLWRATSE